MNNLIADSAYFGAILSLGAYFIGMWMKKKFKLAIFNPLLISMIIVILTLIVFKIDYETYNYSARYISYLLTPATVCLAVPLYEQLSLLRKNWLAIIIGLVSGVLASCLCILVMCILFRLDHEMYVTLLPKSITTAIGMGVSEEMGGISSITVAVICITGVIGNITAEAVCKIFGIVEPVAKGIGIGSASHAIGTTRAMELGEAEGAMSSLSIAVAGLMTVLAASVFSQFL